MDAEENQHQVSLRAHRPWKSLRDSHIPTAATTVEKWKAKGRLPTFPLLFLFLFLFPTSNAKNKGGLAGGATLHLQAHSSIRKCSIACSAGLKRIITGRVIARTVQRPSAWLVLLRRYRKLNLTGIPSGSRATRRERSRRPRCWTSVRIADDLPGTPRALSAGRESATSRAGSRMNEQLHMGSIPVSANAQVV